MRTILLRSLQALVSISAVVVLTGANDAGCGFGGVTTETGGGGVAGGDPGTECPAGTEAQWICGGASHPGDPGCGNTMTPPAPTPCDCPPQPDCAPGQPCPDIACTCDEPAPPPMEDCSLQCVPVQTMCPDGFHHETVCDPMPAPPPPMDPSDPGAPPPMNPDDPAAPPPMDPNDPGAPPSMGGGSDPGFPGGACHDTCVPDGMCPPGTVQQTICTDVAAPMDPNDPATPPDPGQCWNECVPADPGGPCPPGTHPETQCDMSNGPDGTCTFTCVDDGAMGF
jgi:hypothetical protein